ncbi:hypothetical protein BDV29DRAFT_163765 [Aspergillus leporis]|uniref:Uncharacterized protein n=1 Tax=Aspergillus leporis TaxID=41062 RepID=A0A5N5WIP6_9EURO|nr:hypothetical protein BDV29DRAFT_163765 [Aspergillus leporis]
MYMCTSRFEIEEEERIMLSEYLSVQEIQAVKEEKTPQQIVFNPISDEEEEASSTQALSSKSASKRRLSSINKDDIIIQPTIDNDEIDNKKEQIPLPDIQTQYRMSGRVHKRSRLLDKYETNN